MADYLLWTTVAVYLLLIVFLFLKHPIRRKLFAGAGLFFALLLSGIALFSQFSLYSNPVEVSAINYTGKKGILYFFSGSDCSAQVVYSLEIGNNEEKILEVEGERGSFARVVFATNKQGNYTFPFEQESYQKLEIWEKELQAADPCLLTKIEAYHWQQTKYTLSIGLMLLGVLLVFLFLYRDGLKSR
ncbi:DUF423 domain-containing protein [Nafulsella turpanensis]|uniref:DUF423 domain-containing protein n=1 Tax=Nafulsella turpanensis TaxID=1265690 RepID=UPI00034B88F2|nr:DUF423 domain-containing protein [Nafulsella turpanensis]